MAGRQPPATNTFLAHRRCQHYFWPTGDANTALAHRRCQHYFGPQEMPTLLLAHRRCPGTAALAPLKLRAADGQVLICYLATRSGSYSYGLDNYGLRSYDPCSYGPYSYGPYSYGLVMAFIVMAHVVMAPYSYGPYSSTTGEFSFTTQRTRSGLIRLWPMYLWPI